MPPHCPLVDKEWWHTLFCATTTLPSGGHREHWEQSNLTGLPWSSLFNCFTVSLMSLPGANERLHVFHSLEPMGDRMCFTSGKTHPLSALLCFALQPCCFPPPTAVQKPETDTEQLLMIKNQIKRLQNNNWPFVTPWAPINRACTFWLLLDVFS